MLLKYLTTRPLQQKMIQPKMSTLLRLRKPTLRKYILHSLPKSRALVAHSGSWCDHTPLTGFLPLPVLLPAPLVVFPRSPPKPTTCPQITVSGLASGQTQTIKYSSDLVFLSNQSLLPFGYVISHGAGLGNPRNKQVILASENGSTWAAALKERLCHLIKCLVWEKTLFSHRYPWRVTPFR